MNDAAAYPVDAPETPALTQTERVADAYFAPAKTFKDIRRSASWWLPYVLVFLFGLVGSYMLQTNIGWTRMAEQSMKGNSRFDQATPEQQTQQVQLVARTMPIFSYVLYPIVFPVLFGLIIAGILLAVFNFGLGGQARFWQLVAVYFYASLPGLLKAIAFIITVKFGDPENFNLKNPVGTNVGFYLPAETPHWLMAFLSQIDIFTIWVLVLMGLGCAIVAGVKRSTSMITVFGLWAIYLVVVTGFAAAFS